MKSPYLRSDDEVELSQAAVSSSHVRANLRQLVLVVLAFHLGLFCHLFLKVVPKLQKEPTKFTENAAAEAFSMKALESLVEKLPEDDFRSCLQMVIGTAYAKRCDELNLHLRPFTERMLRELRTGDLEQATPVPPHDSTESDEKFRKRKKQKNGKPKKQQNPQEGLLVTSITNKS
jgi:hypothetical protein